MYCHLKIYCSISTKKYIVDTGYRNSTIIVRFDVFNESIFLMNLCTKSYYDFDVKYRDKMKIKLHNYKETLSRG